jgi:CTP:molybdopterin cytidylyltransferase MocA
MTDGAHGSSGIGAVILAAGAGTRLGGVPKALLQSRDGRTFLATILATAREVGLDHAIVVVGPPFGDAVAAHARELAAEVVVNPEPARGMSSSVAVGFAALEQTSCSSAWLWPVDHPDVSPATLRALVAALGAHAAVRPVHHGHGGHPPLVRRALWFALAASTGVDGGARTVLQAAGVHDVAVEDPGCVRDVDTAVDLEAQS